MHASAKKKALDCNYHGFFHPVGVKGNNLVLCTSMQGKEKLDCEPSFPYHGFPKGNNPFFAQAWSPFAVRSNLLYVRCIFSFARDQSLLKSKMLTTFYPMLFVSLKVKKNKKILMEKKGYWYLFFEGIREVCSAFSVPSFPAHRTLKAAHSCF